MASETDMLRSCERTASNRFVFPPATLTLFLQRRCMADDGSQPYLDSDMQSRWWDFGGDTIIRTDKYVRLTPERASRSGWLFSRVPLTATNWEVWQPALEGIGDCL